MKDYSIVDADLCAPLKRLPNVTVGRYTLWLLRTALRLTPRSRRIPREVLIEDVSVTGEQGNKIRLRIYRPIARTGAVPGLLWIHGGGYVMGRPEMDDSSCAEYVRDLGIVVVSVDYRLAPEHPFPAGLHDCLAGFTWLHREARQLGVDASRVAIGGASAGGGLAAALVQLVCARKEESCVFQLLVYPMLDDRTSLQLAADDHDHLVWTKRSNRFGWNGYLGATISEPPAYAVPARRKSLAGLPPAWIGVGTADLFYDEDLAYARRLQESSVACELCVAPGAFHGFDAIAPNAPVTKRFRDAQLAALRRHLSLSESEKDGLLAGPALSVGARSDDDGA